MPEESDDAFVERMRKHHTNCEEGPHCNGSRFIRLLDEQKARIASLEHDLHVELQRGMRDA